MPSSVQSHSSNIYQHQSAQGVFPGQAHPQIAPKAPATALEPSIASTPGSARLGAHNAARGVEDAPPRRTPNGRIGESLAPTRLWHGSQTPQRSASPSAISTHPGQLPPDTNPALREHRGVPHQQRDILDKSEPGSGAKRPLGGVRQDKYARQRVRIASLQAVTARKDARTRRADTKSARVQKPSKRQTVQVAAWIKPALRAELETIARKNGLTLSRTIASLLEEAIRQQLHVQHAVLLQPIIEQAIARQMRAYSGRIAVLLVRSLFASEQTRGLVTNILGRQPGITQPVLREILNSSSRSARRNITHITPQLAALVEDIKEWMEEKEADDTHV